MKTSSKVLLVVVVVLVAALALFFVLRKPGPTDTEQIQAQIETARAAAEAHSASGIMRVVSADYKDSHGLNVDQLHLLLGRGLQQTGSLQIALSVPEITVHGDTADSVSQMQIRASGGMVTGMPTTQTLTLHWRREEAHRWLVFPTRVWRVVGADYQAAMPGEE